MKGILCFFYDSSGVVGYLDVTKIFKYFMKKSYDTYLELLQNSIPEHLESFELLSTVMKFYTKLTINRSTRYSQEVNSVIGYRVFTDYAKFKISNNKIFIQIFETLENIDSLSDQEAKDISRIIKSSMKTFGNFMRGRYINFSSYHFFGDSTFTDYLRLHITLIGSIF